MKIRYTKTVRIYLNELVDILYEKDYFSFKESARQYVRSLLTEVEQTIHLKRKEEAPAYFLRYGSNMSYITCPKSKNTTWYFFFTYHPKELYVIRYITNNHVAGHRLE
ncbi:MAG: hypothetical protein LUG98_16955 [Tannerellaceae bacterium]|nr:hypothetical protein [Tannerellaceae bacterium]